MYFALHILKHNSKNRSIDFIRLQEAIIKFKTPDLDNNLHMCVKIHEDAHNSAT